MNVLILTCTAKVHSNVSVARDVTQDRISDYLKAITFWDTIVGIDKIVVIDNSGYDFSFHKSAAQSRIEFLSFNADGSYRASLGKGYGEYLILKFAYDNSAFIKGAKRVYKCTGRYTLQNVDKLIYGCQRDIDIYADFSRNLSWADSRFFCFKPKFLEIALPYISQIDESQDLHMEVCLARAIHACMARGFEWDLLPDAPVFQGYYGSDNVKYTDSVFKRLVKSFLKLVKRKAINIKY